MYFDDVQKRLLINQPLFDAQNRQTAFAASYLHESIYRALRLNYSARDSRLARHINGCLFTADTASCLNLMETKFPTDRPVVKCADSMNSFFYYATGARTDMPIMEFQYKVVFTRIGGAPLAYEASTTAGGTDQKLTSESGLYGLESDTITVSGLESLPIDIPHTEEKEASSLIFVSEPAISELGQALNLYTDNVSCKLYVHGSPVKPPPPITVLCENNSSVPVRIGQDGAVVNGKKYAYSMSPTEDCGDLFLVSVPALKMQGVRCYEPAATTCSKSGHCAHGFYCH
jgi:hypothetical protein